MSNNLELHFQAVNIFHPEIENPKRCYMIDSLLSNSPGNCLEGDHFRKTCVEQVRSAYSGSHNKQKWQSICIFIIILLTIQEFCNFISFRTNNQLHTSNIIFWDDTDVPGYSTNWRGSGDRSAPQKYQGISLFTIEAIKIASDASCRQLAFYQSNFCSIIQNT